MALSCSGLSRHLRNSGGDQRRLGAYYQAPLGCIRLRNSRAALRKTPGRIPGSSPRLRRVDRVYLLLRHTRILANIFLAPTAAAMTLVIAEAERWKTVSAFHRWW